MDSADPEPNGAAPEADWDETRIMTALGRLQDIHIRLRNLRGTIPELIRPILSMHSSPEDLYTDIAQCATTAVENLNHFKQRMAEQESQDVLKRAKHSRAQNDEGITGWLVTQHEDWLDRNAQTDLYELKLGDGDDVSAKNVDDDSAEQDINTTILKFRSNNPKVGVVLDQHPDFEWNEQLNLQGAKEMIIATIDLPPPTRMQFKVVAIPIDQRKVTYKVTGKQVSNLDRGIHQCIEERPHPNDLRSLLDMIASYNTIKFQVCQKCNKLIGPQASFPIVRSKRSTKNADGAIFDEWLSFHTECAS